MILDSGQLNSFCGKNFFGTFYLLKVMVRHTNVPYFSRLYKRSEIWSPTLNISRIVYPIYIYIVRAESLQTVIKHGFYRILCVSCDLRCKFGRKNNCIAFYSLYK